MLMIVLQVNSLYALYILTVWNDTVFGVTLRSFNVTLGDKVCQ